MTHSPLMYGLIKLHRQLDGELKRTKKNVAHVRAVIEIVSPGFDISTIRPKKPYKPNPWFHRGEIFLAALGVLREAETPLSQTEIVKRMLAKRGVASPTPAELKDMRSRLIHRLNYHQTTMSGRHLCIRCRGAPCHRKSFSLCLGCYFQWERLAKPSPQGHVPTAGIANQEHAQTSPIRRTTHVTLKTARQMPALRSLNS